MRSLITQIKRFIPMLLFLLLLTSVSAREGGIWYFTDSAGEYSVLINRTSIVGTGIACSDVTGAVSNLCTITSGGGGGGNVTHLDNLSDVDLTGLVTGNILEYNGSHFIPGADDAGAGGFDLNVSGDSGSGVITDAEVFSILGVNGLSSVMDTNTLSINISNSTWQSRVSGSCPSGQSIRVIFGDGSVTCEIDTDSDTTYTAGGPYMVLTATTFSVNETALNATIDARDSDTQYTNGTGLNLTGTTFSILSSLYTNWNTAYGWGDHGLVGYSTGSHTVDTNETTRMEAIYDEVVTNRTNWNTAFGWSDHSTQGYLTSLNSSTINDNASPDITWTSMANSGNTYSEGIFKFVGSGTNWTNQAQIISIYSDDTALRPIKSFYWNGTQYVNSFTVTSIGALSILENFELYKGGEITTTHNGDLNLSPDRLCTDTTGCTTNGSVVIYDYSDGSWINGESSTPLKWFVADSSGSFNGVATKISPIVEDTIGVNWGLAFYTNTNGVESEAVRIDNDGDVGIGETVPLKPLHVVADTAHGVIRLEENSGGESWDLEVDADGDLNLLDIGSSSRIEFLDGGVGTIHSGYLNMTDNNVTSVDCIVFSNGGQWCSA